MLAVAGCLSLAALGAQELASAVPAGGQPAPLRGAEDASIFTRRNARTIAQEIPAPRGQITDREGEPLAQSRIAYQLALQFEQFEREDRDLILAWAKKRLEAAEALVEGLHLPTDDEVFSHYRHRRWLPLYLSSHLDEEEHGRLVTQLPRGLILQPVYERYYPEKTLAAHIIGYTGSVGPLETGPINQNEPMFEEIEGRSGFEKFYDNELTGRPGTKRLIFDENGNKLLEEQTRRPRPGGTVVSTLNLRWQKQAEKVLEQKARRGAMVVIDAVTGEVLAMASKPSFDLNDWIPGISQEALDELQEDDGRPLFARAFQGAYPPASSFKPIVALAALNDDTITRNSTVYCPAFIQYGNHKLWNWSRSEYGDLSVVSAIKWSNNPWFAQVGNRVGSGTFLGLARRLGFGSTSGLPLIGEEDGLVPSRDWVLKNYKRPITEGDAANWSIGQGAVLATPLQVAQAMAGIANGGALPKLHLVMQVQDPYGRVIRTAQPERRHWLGVDPEAVDIVREGMHEVVSGGTGRSAGLGWTEVCGKTGTGQWGPPSKEQGVAWFAGFLPYDQPRLAFACLYEGRPHQKVSGSRNACPMVPAFFNPLREEIEEMIAPAPKALVIEEIEEGVDPEEAAEPEGVLRAIPVDPLDPAAEIEDEEIPRALEVLPEDINPNP